MSTAGSSRTLFDVVGMSIVAGAFAAIGLVALSFLLGGPGSAGPLPLDVLVKALTNNGVLVGLNILLVALVFQLYWKVSELTATVARHDQAAVSTDGGDSERS
jgi:hypothetical protein